MSSPVQQTHRPGRRQQAVLRRFLIVLAFVLLARHWIGSPILISGGSMLPTLRHGQLALLDKLSYRFRQPQREDVVAIQTKRELIVKRIVGRPGEHVAVRQGVLEVNGRPLERNYAGSTDSPNIAPGRLEAGRYLVAGDNRAEGSYIVVSRERIVGRLMLPRIPRGGPPRPGLEF